MTFVGLQISEELFATTLRSLQIIEACTRANIHIQVLKRGHYQLLQKKGDTESFNCMYLPARFFLRRILKLWNSVYTGGCPRTGQSLAHYMVC